MAASRAPVASGRRSRRRHRTTNRFSIGSQVKGQTDQWPSPRVRKEDETLAQREAQDLVQREGKGTTGDESSKWNAQRWCSSANEERSESENCPLSCAFINDAHQLFPIANAQLSHRWHHDAHQQHHPHRQLTDWWACTCG